MKVLMSLAFVIVLVQYRKTLAYNDANWNVRMFDTVVLCIYIASIYLITIGLRTYNDDNKIITNPIKEYHNIIYTLVEGIINGSFFEHFHWVEAALEGYILNILLFIPIGFLLPYTNKQFGKCLITILFGLVFSLFIESVQLIMRLGWFDTTDIIHNTLGTFVGFYIYSNKHFRVGNRNE